MPSAKRQMHLGVFVLGTGNHSAGWRYDGAFTSSSSLPVMQAIARTAERGKFDLFFISDSVVMDPGDHPSFVNRFEPTTLLAALSMTTPRAWPTANAERALWPKKTSSTAIADGLCSEIRSQRRAWIRASRRSSGSWEDAVMTPPSSAASFRPRARTTP